MHASISGVPRRRLALLVAGLFATFPHLPALAQEATVGAMLTVTVNGERESDAKQARSRGALGSLSDLETPFATATVGSEKLEDRQVNTLANVFSEDPSVTTKGGTYTQSAYAINVRGLTLDFTNGYKIDGQPFQMYGVELPLETMESVQLLKGATGFLYGFAAPGGIVNYVTKRPTEQRTFSAAVGYTSGGLVREHIDTGGRVGDRVDGSGRFGYRLNLAHEEGHTYNGAALNRDAAALALDARLAPDVTWSANFLYQERDLDGGVPTVSLQAYPAASAGLPRPLDGQADLGAYPTTYYYSTMYMGTSALDWRINRDWKLNVNYGYSLKRIDSSIETLYLLNRAGDYSNRLNPYYRPELTYHALNAIVEGAFETGTLKHRVSFGAGRQTLTRMLNVQSALSLFGPKTVGNLYAPPPALVDTSVNDPRLFKISDYAQKSVFASDNIDITRNWSVLAGVRWMDYENENWNASGARTSYYRKKPNTPTAALLYKPSSNTTFYTSYVEALEDGGTVSTTYANANESLPPLTSRQAELGVKTDGGSWGASAALFRVKRGAAYADYSSNPQGIYVQAGELRYQGLELAGHATLQRWLTVNAGATWLDAEYRATTPALVGNRIESTPRFSAVLGAEAKVPQVPGLSFQADASHVGAQQANSANTFEVPSATLFNAGASYRTRFDGHYVTLRVQVNNLANRAYWYSTGSNALQIGAPRLVSVNARFDY
jgi:iron complex outermembrane recepter protein